jgi:hypothetical protein
MAGKEHERGKEASEEEPVEANPRGVGQERRPDAGAIRVRPFHEVIEHGAGRPATEVSGQLRGETFVLSALGRSIPLVTLSASRDADGELADIAIGEWDHGDVRVRVEPEYDEPLLGLPEMPPGGEIALYWGADLRVRAEFELAGRGMDPRRHIVLAPAAENLIAIHFDFDGSPNGTGYTDRPGVASRGPERPA